jgi:hypothetical protein
MVAFRCLGDEEMNFGDDGYNVDQMLCFVVGINLQFYPQIGNRYELQIKAWAAARRAEQRPESAEERVEER